MGKWSHYKKRYNKNWEKEAALRGWIASVPFDDLKAFCRYCRCELRAHHDDLISHAKTAKHKRSSEPFASSRIFNEIVASCANAIGESVDLELVPQVATCHPSASAARPATVYYLRPIVRDISASGIVLGNQLNEGKTKIIFAVRDEPGLVLIQSKDRITAGDGARAHNLEGKARISTETTSDVFQLLNNAGIKTHFVRQQGEREFVARGCEMIPIEFVTRRIATGSFLKRNPGVPEGFRFCPPKLEFFLKDDANHDPQWSYEQIISAKMKFRDIEIGATELDIICKTTVCVFEILERAWASLDCALIDMKIEFGVDIENQEIVLADIIDSDSWRLWPSGDRRLMKDKQVYRELAEVTPEALEIVKKNFAWIGEKVKVLAERQSTGRVVVLMGSSSDKEFGKKIQNQCLTFDIECVLRVTSAHKGPDSTLKIVAEYEGDGIPTVFVAVAGRSNGLGPVVSGNTTYPVINCPPLSGEWGPHDLWSSVRLPSGLGCSTVLSPEAAALQAAQIFAVSDHVVWGKLRASQLNRWIGLRRDDSDCCN